MNRHSSAPDTWTLPRPHRDASTRMHKHGPVLPMEYDNNPYSMRMRVATWCVVLILLAIFIWSIKP